MARIIAKQGFPLALILFLSGCAVNNDMLNNDFVGIKTQQAPSKIVGLWSGNMGPYLTTIRVDPDGRGVMCSSLNDHNSVHRIKYRNGAIHAQSGGRVEIKGVVQDSMVLRSPYLMSRDYQFYRDQDLKNAPVFCVDKMAPN